MRFTAVQRWPEFLVAPATASSAALSRSLSLRSFEYDQRIIAAKLKRRPLVARLGRDELSNPHPAGKGNDRDIGIGHHLIADVIRPAGDHLEHFRRQARVIENVGKCKRRERREFRGLAHHAIIRGNGRRHLVRHHVERMVERRDGRNHADRIALGENLARLALRREITGKNLPVIENAKLGRKREHVIGAPAFVNRILH